MPHRPPSETPEHLLYDRDRLIRRWRHGSDAFFLRHERGGRLAAVTDGTKIRYTREAVYAFEGGPPPSGMEVAYQADLVTEAEAAKFCSVAPSYILTAARKGELPSRRIGRAYRFVPAEVEAWQKRRFLNRNSLKNRRNSPDE